MNALVRRTLYATVIGFAVLQTAETLQIIGDVVMDALDHDEPIPEPEPPLAAAGVDASRLDHWIDDVARGLDPAAGVPHGHVGNDRARCSLCLCPALHPLHVLAADAREG